MSKNLLSKDNLFAFLLFLIAGFAIIWLFSSLPFEDAGIAIDWKKFWLATHNFSATYGSSGLFNPPWILPLIWPITLFPFAISWGLSAYGTLIVLVSSIPKSSSKKYWITSALLLATAYPTLRQLVDGNLEAVVIWGVLITLWASKNRNPLILAIGILFSAAKIHASWLLLIGLIIWVWREWPKRKIVKSITWTIGLAIPFLFWRGADWLNAVASTPQRIPSSINLIESLAQLGLPFEFIGLVWIAIFFFTLRSLFKKGWQLSRERIGWLTSASLLLAPYAGSNSVLTPLALGVIPFLQKNPVRGIALFALFNLPYLASGSSEFRTLWESSYWTFVLLLTWITLRNAD